MTKNKDSKKESLAELAVDPDVLARELALEIEIDPLEQIDEDTFSKETFPISAKELDDHNLTAATSFFKALINGFKTIWSS